MSVLATLTLKVTVEVNTDPGINTTDAYEPAYDYLAVRDVSFSQVELKGDLKTLELVAHGGADDLDPDGLLLSSVYAALENELKAAERE